MGVRGEGEGVTWGEVGYGLGPAGGFNLTSTIQCGGGGGEMGWGAQSIGENMGRCNREGRWERGEAWAEVGYGLDPAGGFNLTSTIQCEGGGEEMGWGGHSIGENM